MPALACKLLVSLSLVMLVGCDLKQEVVGATVPLAETGTGTDTTGADTDTAPTTGLPDGSPCQLAPEEFFHEATTGGSESGGFDPADWQPDYADALITPGHECAGDICLFASDVVGPNCDVDADCPADERFLGCEDGRCRIDPVWGQAQTTCTRTCDVDTDCAAVGSCNQLPVCAPIARLGSFCCQSVCVCPDEIQVASLQQLRSECESGTLCQ